MDLVAKLNLLGNDVLNQFPRINCGGCCVYASMVMTELKKHNVSSAGIAAAYEFFVIDKDIDKARANIKHNNLAEWNNSGIHLNHVGLEFTINGAKMHYDTSGVKTADKMLDGMTIYKGRLTAAEMSTLARQKAGWNTHFSRSQIPAIRRLVKRHLTVDTVPV